jgi:hypothetical protein
VQRYPASIRGRIAPVRTANDAPRSHQ